MEALSFGTEGRLNPCLENSPPKFIIILFDLKFIFLNQPADDKAKQEDQSEERSQGNDGQNDGEQFEAPSWLLTRQVVNVGLLDVPEQNYDSEALREVENDILSSEINVRTFSRGRKIP